MTVARRLVGIVSFAIAIGMGGAVAQEPVSSAPALLSPPEMEEFLLNAEIVRLRAIGEGTTDSIRATLSDGTLTHDAHVQTIDDSQTIYLGEINFRDCYCYNIAAYRLARLLGIDNVPMSVERWVDRKVASVTWWIDDVMMDEEERRNTGATDPDARRFTHYEYRMDVFDELIYNVDRNLNNVVYTSDWTRWMIDHTRAFRLSHELRRPNKLIRVDRTLYEKLKALTAEALAEAAGSTLTREEVEAVIARRDAIVTLFEEKMAARGEAAVLYPSPVTAANEGTSASVERPLP
jgi:hypothetical protein